MAATPTLEPMQELSYQLASALRWVALAAGREQAKTILGVTRVEAHLQKLQSSGEVPAEMLVVSLDVALSAADAVASDSSEKAGVKAVAHAASQAVREAGNVSPGCGTLEAEASGAPPVLLSMAKALGLYWWFAALQQKDQALRVLSLGLQDFWRCYWRQPPWRGANLGGWLLLEPGPASPFFSTCQSKIEEIKDSHRSIGKSGMIDGAPTENPPHLEDEHALCTALEAAGGLQLKQELFKVHRSRHYDESTFSKLAACGLNAVRLPFGHWVVGGPAEGEAFEGPCVEVLDRAVELASAHGLQVLLDLHGNPGGESGERPCGRRDSTWTWHRWRRDEAVELLRRLAARFCGAACVTGVQVCNEPCPSVPTEALCTFYERAVRAIREGGMGPERVAVVLPVFTQWRLPEILGCWHSRGNFLKFDNVAFDLHYYHNFSKVWKLLSQSQHLQVVAEHARELKLLPGAVVGEWSLSRPGNFTDEERAEFAVQQVLAYNHASHGWFFWNWHDHDFLPDWDLERGVLEGGKLPCPLGPQELNGSLFPDWEIDSWRSVPSTTLPGLWPRMLAWGYWLRSFVAS